MQKAAVLLLSLAICAKAHAEVGPEIRAYLDPPHNDVVYAHRDVDGSLKIILLGHVTIYDWRQKGLTLPITITNGRVGVSTSIVINGQFRSIPASGIWGVQGELAEVGDKELNIGWLHVVPISKLGACDAVLSLTFTKNGKEMPVVSPPMHFQVLAMPNQLPDPTSPSVTAPAGAGASPSVTADH
jgi:hypothetical protein